MSGRDAVRQPLITGTDPVNSKVYMTVAQEDALYDYLDAVRQPFSESEVTAFIRKADSSGIRRLAGEVRAFIDSRRLAFPLPDGRWLSRRACFESAQFVVAPSRLEILNGILVPGHRCVPFANPILLPHEYLFRWHGAVIPGTTTEGPPEDFYPFYGLFGEEYAPQYIARDNIDNEAAFNADPYEDPPEVSIHTLDLRTVYRETSFVPGNRFVVRVADWKNGIFDLERVEQCKVDSAALVPWKQAIEAGFAASFDRIGPAASTEEQIAFAYFFGGELTRRIPAYSLEEFLYERTEGIDTVSYGMETRFWFAGKEIPDEGPWNQDNGPPDKTELEEILAGYGIPISEYVVQSYVRDALFRNDAVVKTLIERIVPPSISMDARHQIDLVRYLVELFEEYQSSYNVFTDRAMGPLRQRVGELHTAVVDLVARLAKGEASAAWLPKHTFVILSQIEAHAAHLLEDLDIDEAPEDQELEGMDNSLDGMIETYEDIKERIEESRDTFRRSRISVVKDEPAAVGVSLGRTIQAALAGTEVWRRFEVPESISLAELHRVIQKLFSWSGGRLHGFVVDGEVFGPDPGEGERAERDITIGQLAAEGVTELGYDYDYGAEWEVKLTLLHRLADDNLRGPRCVAGSGAAPPEHIGGPLRYRRFVSALQKPDGTEKTLALNELGPGFDPDHFDVAGCNQLLSSEAF